MTEMTFPLSEDLDALAGFAAADEAQAEAHEIGEAEDLLAMPQAEAEMSPLEPSPDGPEEGYSAEAEPDLASTATEEGFSTVWDGVELVLRQMVGALDALRGDLQGVGQKVDAAAVRPLPTLGNDKPMGEVVGGLKAHNREMIDRLELHIVKLFGRVNADALDLRGQMNRIERSLAQMVAAQKPAYLQDATPDWAQKLLAKYEEMESNIRRFDTEQIDDLKLRVEMMDRKLNDIIHGRPALPSEGGTSTSQELKLLLAEVIALQQRDEAISARMAG